MQLQLTELDVTLAVCRLSPDAPVPDMQGASFVSVTRTALELSIVCPESMAPADATVENGFRAFRIDGVLDFALIGILADLTTALAKADISVFAISTFDTDYLLVKKESVEKTRKVLAASGHAPA